MPRTHLRALGALATLAVATGTATSAPAQAAQPLAHTTYEGTGGQESVAHTATFTLKVAGSSSRIKKAVVHVTCPEGHLKAVFRNVPVDDSGFFYRSTGKYKISGSFRNRHAAELDFDPEETGEACGTYVVSGTVHD